MAEAPVRADLDESLDVERDLPAEVALDLVAPVDQLAQPVDLLLGEVGARIRWLVGSPIPKM